MKLTTIILTHTNPQLTSDTVDSAETWVGNQTLLLVDEIGWPLFKDLKIGNSIIEEGFLHAYNKSPYRNYALGLKKAYNYFPDSDWFIYVEYDTLFTSGSFKIDLERLERHNVWMAGVDLRRYEAVPFLGELIGSKIDNSYYFLGCCHFLHRNFVSKIINFIDLLLEETKDFKKGYFPGYNRWAFEEELWATLAYHFGGSLAELSCWQGSEKGDWQELNSPRLMFGNKSELWRGDFEKYPIRNTPEITTIDINSRTSIIHPIKNYNEIRKHQGEKRQMVKKRMRPIYM